MRQVAVTEGDKVEAQIRLRLHGQRLRRRRPRRRRRGGVRPEVVDALRAATTRRRTSSCPSCAPAARAARRCVDAARIEAGLRAVPRATAASTPSPTPSRTCTGSPQLPGHRRAAADGRRLRVRRRGRLEDRGARPDPQGDGDGPARRDLVHGGLHLRPGPGDGPIVLGAHMLEICPSIAAGRPSARSIRSRSAGATTRSGSSSRPRRGRRRRRAHRPRRPLPARRERDRGRSRRRQPLPQASGRAGRLAAEARSWRPRPRPGSTPAAPITPSSRRRSAIEPLEDLARDRRHRAARDRRADAQPRLQQRAALEPGLLPARPGALMHPRATRTRPCGEPRDRRGRPRHAHVRQRERGRPQRGGDGDQAERGGLRGARRRADRASSISASGDVLDGDLRPSSDAPTHLVLYRAFEDVGGIVHTHSPFATAWAQAGRELPCLGTTHADHFAGPVPVTRPLRGAEIGEAYEERDRRVIVETIQASGGGPLAVPGGARRSARAVRLGSRCRDGGRERDRARGRRRSSPTGRRVAARTGRSSTRPCTRGTSRRKHGPSPLLRPAMKALRLHGRGDLRLARRAPSPNRAAGESCCACNAVGLCGSDRHWFAEGAIGDARPDAAARARPRVRRDDRVRPAQRRARRRRPCRCRAAAALSASVASIISASTSALPGTASPTARCAR